MAHVGVDGCKAGWLAVAKEGRELQYGVFRTVRDLVKKYAHAERILIDVPIGLPWRACPRRPCDQLARSHLAARRFSVFAVPCRAAAHADSIEQAKRLNLAELGLGLSQQTWGISGKIAEVDALVLERRAFGTNLREAHPELCFWGLAGRKAMQYPKKTREGAQERLDVLCRYEPRSQVLVDSILKELPRMAVGRDDILDALVAFITACAPSAQLRQLKGAPAIDERGVPMEIVYWSPRV